MIKSYSELPINRYLDIKALVEEDLEPMDMQVKLLSILDGRSENELLNMNFQDFHALVQDSAFLMDQPVPSKKVPSKIIINKHTYEIKKDVSKFTTAQYIDFQTLTAKEDRDKYLAYIMACFLIPEGKRYNDGYDIGEVVQELGEYLSIQDAINVSFFFQRKYLNSINDTLIYLEFKTKRMLRKTKDEKTKAQLKDALERMKGLRDLVQNGVS